MPLEDLKTYKGSSPCPADFDQFWEAALAEMVGIDPQVELERAEFQVPFAECFNLYFTGVGNARIYAKYVRPKNLSGKKPIVLQFHGYTGNSGDWSDKLAFAALGFSVLALDSRGQGGLSRDVGGTQGNTLQGHIIRGIDDGPEKLLFRSNFLDTVELAMIAEQLPGVDADKIYAMGGSQGGGLSLVCASLYPKIKKAAVEYPFLCDYKRVWDLDVNTEAYAELKKYFRFFDPQHKREKETFDKLAYIDVQNLVGRIKASVLFAATFRDETCPPSTQFAAYNKIRSQKRLFLYPDYGHEFLPGFNDEIFEFFLAG